MGHELAPIDPLIFASVGLVAFAITFLGTYEVQKIQSNEALKAGLASAANVFLGAVLLYYFIDNPLNMASEALGSFLGTYAMVECNRRRRVKINGKIQEN